MDITDIVVTPDTLVYEPWRQLNVGEVSVVATEPFTGWLRLLDDADGNFSLRENRLNTARDRSVEPGDYTVTILASTRSGGPDDIDEGVSFEKDIVVHVLAPFQSIDGIALDELTFVADGVEKKVATIDVQMNTGGFGNRPPAGVGSTSEVELQQSQDVADLYVARESRELWVRRGVLEPRTYAVQLRAIWDGALNSPFSRAFTVTGTEAPLEPITIFGDSQPADLIEPDPNAVELGCQFIVSGRGIFRAMRFFKWTANTGPHVGHLWSGGGTLLATANFDAITPTGWQQSDFDVAVNAHDHPPGTLFTVSYHTVSGNYSRTQNFFASAHSDPTGRITAPASGTVPRGNGVFTYGPTPPLFPERTWNATNYFVDIVFEPERD